MMICLIQQIKNLCVMNTRPINGTDHSMVTPPIDIVHLLDVPDPILERILILVLAIQVLGVVRSDQAIG